MLIDVDGSIFAAYGVTSVGTKVFVAPDGTIIDVHHGAMTVEQMASVAQRTLAPAFPDVGTTHAYYAAITGLARRDVIGGYAKGSFGPGDPVTRQQFAKMIVLALGLPVTGTEICPFTDVTAQLGSDRFYPSKYVAVSASQGIVTGQTSTTFAPNDGITRAEMATMVVIAAQISGIDLIPSSADDAGTFKGYSDTTHGDDVHLAERNTLLAGLSVIGDPNAWMAGGATRGEAAQALWNLTQLQTK